MRTIEKDMATASLADYAEEAQRGPVVITRDGRPNAARWRSKTRTWKPSL